MQIKSKPLEILIQTIFQKAGCKKIEADRIAEYLTRASLVGHDSHGVIRTPRYVDMIKDGHIVPNVKPQILMDSNNFSIVDGVDGFGQTVGPFSCMLGIKKAKKYGNSIIAIKNSGHLGRIGDFSEMAAAKNLISIHFVNSIAGLLVSPFGSWERRFSTNPFSAGVPIKNNNPFILDFATSLVAEGKAYVAHQGGKAIPKNALIDDKGNDTNDTSVLYGTKDPNAKSSRGGTGALKPFGLHKGSGLSFLCEFLAGALTGSGMGREDKSKPFRNGMLSIYINPSKYVSGKDYNDEIKRYIKFFKSAKPIVDGNEILMPGEPELRNKKERLKNGIPMTKITWDAITETANYLKIDKNLITKCL
jgi:uncharacterized oxidoreductase